MICGAAGRTRLAYQGAGVGRGGAGGAGGFDADLLEAAATFGNGVGR